MTYFLQHNGLMGFSVVVAIANECLHNTSYNLFVAIKNAVAIVTRELPVTSHNLQPNICKNLLQISQREQIRIQGNQNITHTGANKSVVCLIMRAPHTINRKN